MGKYLKIIQKQQIKKKSTSSWNDKFQLSEGSNSVSDIQDCFDCIIKKHETLTDNPPLTIYVNEIGNRIAFEIQTRYYLILLTLDKMKYLEALKTR